MISLEDAAKLFGKYFCEHAKTFSEDDPRRVRSEFFDWKVFRQPDFFGMPGAWMFRYSRSDIESKEKSYNPLIKIVGDFRSRFYDKGFRGTEEDIAKNAQKYADVPLKEPLFAFIHQEKYDELGLSPKVKNQIDQNTEKDVNKLINDIDKIVLEKLKNIETIEIPKLSYDEEFVKDYNVIGQSIQFFWDTVINYRVRSSGDDWSQDNIVDCCEDIYHVQDVIWEENGGLYIEYNHGHRPDSKTSEVPKFVEIILSLGGNLIWEYCKNGKDISKVSDLCITSYLKFYILCEFTIQHSRTASGEIKIEVPQFIGIEFAKRFQDPLRQKALFDTLSQKDHYVKQIKNCFEQMISKYKNYSRWTF